MVLDQTLTRRDIKRNNRLRIYNRLRDAGSFSCLDISRDLGLSLPTVGKNISDLEEAGARAFLRGKEKYRRAQLKAI